MEKKGGNGYKLLPTGYKRKIFTMRKSAAGTISQENGGLPLLLDPVQQPFPSTLTLHWMNMNLLSVMKLGKAECCLPSFPCIFQGRILCLLQH